MDFLDTKVEETLKMTLTEDEGEMTGQTLNSKRERHKVDGRVWAAKNGRLKMTLKRYSSGNVQSYDLTYNKEFKSWEGGVHNTWNNGDGHAVLTKLRTE